LSSFRIPTSPPSSAPFPYTTLFRSMLEVGQHQVPGQRGALQVPLGGDPHGEANQCQPGDQKRDDTARTHGSPRGRIGWLLHVDRSEEHTSELQSHLNIVCRLLLEKK